MRGVWIDDRGSVVIMFGLTAMLLGLMSAAAIDYSIAISTRTSLYAAADAAALAAVNAAVEQRNRDASLSPDIYLAGGRTVGEKYFDQNLSKLRLAEKRKPNLALREEGGAIKARIDFDAVYASMFMGLAGIDTLRIVGRAEATSRPPKYARINLLIDTSGSMGIGATAADQSTMMAQVGCTIACHYTDTVGSVDNLAAVRASGAKLRLDVVKEAAGELLRKLDQNKEADGQYEIAVYSFSNQLRDAVRPTTDIAAAIAGLAPIEISGGAYEGGSNLQHSLFQFASGTTAAGDGSSASSRRTFTLILSDGVENSTTYRELGGLMEPIYDVNFRPGSPKLVQNAFETIQGFEAAACDDIKDKDHEVIALNVEYLVPSIAPDANQNRYQYIEATLKPDIMQHFESCASGADKVFNASSPDEIESAFKNIYNVLVASTVRLTN